MAALGNASHASQIRMGVCARMYDVVCPLGRMLTIPAGDETEAPLMPGCDRYVALVSAVFGCLGLMEVVIALRRMKTKRNKYSEHGQNSGPLQVNSQQPSIRIEMFVFTPC